MTDPSPETGLELHGISHAYGNNQSIKDLSLTVAKGEVLSLLGHSGCGKTTLMRIIAGVERQSAGRVVLNGREVAGERLFHVPEQRGVGLMFQDYALFPHMTVLANVAYGLRKVPKAEARRQAGEALERVNLGSYGEKYPHELSGGEQQRVALARAIAPRPSILLMDEPFSGLDRRLRDKVRDEMISILRETNATCVVVTHDPEDAMRMGDKIALMRSGELVQHGTAWDLFHSPVDLFAARFFSELNEIPAEVKEKGVDTPLGLFPNAGHAVGANVTLCIRPQGLLPQLDGENHVNARILSRRFLGEVDLLTMAVDGLEQVLQARVAAGNSFEPGRLVGLSVAPQDVLTFEVK